MAYKQKKRKKNPCWKGYEMIGMKKILCKIVCVITFKKVCLNWCEKNCCL